MKKPISISNLTLDLYLDYVRPAALAAGILEEATNTEGLKIYITDAAAADEIAHCMYCACMCAGNDGIERTHEEYIRHEAERMIGQLEISIKYDLHGYADTLAALLAAMAAALQPAEAPTTAPAAEAEQQPTETEEAPQAAPVPICTIAMNEGDGRQTITWNPADGMLYSDAQEDPADGYGYSDAAEALDAASYIWGNPIWEMEII